MATIASPPQQAVLTRLFLPVSVLDSYRKEAAEFGVELEEMITSRLTECVSYNATKPLYFNDKDRQELETILGRNVHTVGAALDVFRRFLSVKLNEAVVTLPPLVLERLRTRCPRGQDFVGWMQKQIAEWAERACGMR